MHIGYIPNSDKTIVFVLSLTVKAIQTGVATRQEADNIAVLTDRSPFISTVLPTL